MLFLAAFVGTALALPAVSGAQTPTQDSVSGSGNSNCGLLEVSAQSGPSGENPTGQFSCATLFSGPVTCLNVQGNVALLTVQDSVIGAGIAVRITDNGPSGADRVEAIPGPGCAEPKPSYDDLFFTGDITVVDAPPLPTAKYQCKNGGWKPFGFKNQGQCIAFVKHGPR
jgi:hypothetical protein